ncbi:MAG TPA: allophanate hydrolase subunit 2 family protein, partial [Micromonosporaceae bacterium]
MLEVVRPGALTTVQDHGRVGWAHLGVPRSGALDRPALDLANALVGNAPGAAGLEITLTGCTLRFTRSVTIAVTGAAAVVTIEGRAAAANEPVAVRATETVSIGAARHGVRTYLGIRGGIEVTPVLGSRSTDTLSGLGPPSLRVGDRLRIGSPDATVLRSVIDPRDGERPPDLD